MCPSQEIRGKAVKLKNSKKKKNKEKQLKINQMEKNLKINETKLCSLKGEIKLAKS